MYQRHCIIQDRWSEPSPSGDVHGMQVGTPPRGGAGETSLTDLTCLPKMGFKGRGAEAFLKEHGFAPPAAIYEWQLLTGGGLLLRIDRHEFLLEEGEKSSHLPRLREALPNPAGEVAPVERQECGLLLRGPQAHDVLRQTCGYNFALPTATLIRTRVAGVSATIIQMSPAPESIYRIWFDISFAYYMWSALREIITDLKQPG